MSDITAPLIISVAIATACAAVAMGLAAYLTRDKNK
jgi:hypothetical protein